MQISFNRYSVFSKKSLIIILFIAFGAILYFFNPENTIWLPKCPILLLTGFQCPSCGGQRAFYQLVHGNLIEAFMYNPFLIISIPYAVLLILVTWFIPKHKCIRLRKFCYHKATVFTYIALMLIWWILRNIMKI